MTNSLNLENSAEALAAGSRYLQFSLGKEEYAIPLLRVREVIAPPEITPIPQTPPHFQGIMNLRGQVITVVDLRGKLGIKALNGSETAVIIADLDGICVGVTVDAINSVICPGEDEIQPKPEISASKAGDYVSAVFRNQSRLVLLLDIAKVLNMEDRQSIASAQQKKAG